MNFTKENMSTIAIGILNITESSSFEPATEDSPIKIMEGVNLIQARSFNTVTWDVYFHDNYIMTIDSENCRNHSLPSVLTDAFWSRYVRLYADSVKHKVWTLALNGKPIEMPAYNITGASENKNIGDAVIEQMVMRYKGNPIVVINHYPDYDKTTKQVVPELFNFIKERALSGEIEISLFD